MRSVVNRSPYWKKCQSDSAESCWIELRASKFFSWISQAEEAVWRVLRKCGLKQQVTWEDAVAEARRIQETSDQKLSQILFEHLETTHQTIVSGDRAHCLKLLQELEWVTARQPAQDVGSMKPENCQHYTLASLDKIFPASESKFAWAVQSSSTKDGNLLQAKRSVQKEPEVLVDQLQTLARAVPKYSGTSWIESEQVREASPEALNHISAVLQELVRCHKDSAKQHLQKLSTLAYIPCQGSKGSEGFEGSEDGALLFSPKHAALQSVQSHQKLLPAFGIVHPCIQSCAWATGVQKKPHVEALVDAIPRFDLDLAVALCIELAEQADLHKEFEKHLNGLKVPTNSGKLLPVEKVYINDAMWKGTGDLQTLDDRISHDHGRKLGCKSVRERLKRECEHGAEDEDAFGQEADLVNQALFLHAARLYLVAPFPTSR